MEKLTEKRVHEVIAELENALIENVKLEKESESVGLKLKANQKRLSLARDEIRWLKL